jgi:hypothetical protein
MVGARRLGFQAYHSDKALGAKTSVCQSTDMIELCAETGCSKSRLFMDELCDAA